MDGWFKTILRVVWSSAIVIACSGCWQEVHYKPDTPVVVTPVINDTPAGNDEAQAHQSSADNTQSEDQTSEEVTADELFAAPDVAEPSETPGLDAPTDDVSAESDETVSPDASDAETQETPLAPPDLTVELPSEPETEAPSAPDKDVPAAENIVDVAPSASTVEIMRPSKTALAVWRMSSRWSFAAAIYAKGQPEDRFRESLEQATYAAELVGAELPSFPASDGIALESAVIGYLLSSGPADVVGKLGEDFLPEYEALTELALRTNALLLVYTPKSQQLDPLISSIRQSAERSGLPAKLWTDLIDMLERREPFANVKQRLLSFHTEVGDYLAGAQ